MQDDRARLIGRMRTGLRVLAHQYAQVLARFNTPGERSKIAICYHGPPRSLRTVLQSHQTHIFAPLQAANIDYKIFVHTWLFEGPQLIWEKAIKTPNDYDAFTLLQPHCLCKDNQDHFLATINFADYFSQEAWETYGNNRWLGEWRPGLIRNYLCSLESQKRVTAMVSGDFQYVLYLRPDVEFTNSLNCRQIKRLKIGQIILPNFDHFEGFNDRFAIMTLQTAKLYGSRVDWLPSFRKHQGRIVSEKYTKYFILSNKLRPIFSSIRFTIVRPQ